MAALRSALLDALTPADVRALARALLDQAKAGDAAAARLLLAYTVGRPAEAADPDRPDVAALADAPIPRDVAERAIREAAARLLDRRV